ncbi:hypothetical protein LJ725_28430 [Reyranella aquatilis]|uniref:Uncharacterized protein n=1 Tax=Reyranella aquatilis TaxID=2035356 RepID=A0ABS8L3M3_9HYPH|nr:hypothetical protein [Reyranella aquatilis]MCC8432914.1 hypothetical protein [Reyranella aquatilis]
MVASTSFPKSYRFEIRPVIGPPGVGTLCRLAAICEDPNVVVWLDPNYHSGVHECHIVTETMWAYFSLSDYTLEKNVPSSCPDWKIFRGTIWAWNSSIGGSSPARPDHLLPRQYGGLFPTVKLDDASRRRITRLVHPALDWWPKEYAADKPISPNPTRRLIDYGDLARFL